MSARHPAFEVRELKSLRAELERQAELALEETVRDIAARFGLEPEDLDLGPLGRLL